MKNTNVVPLKQAQTLAVDDKLKAAYQPTDSRELRTLRQQHARRQKANAVPRLKIEQKNGQSHISIDHPDGATGFTLYMEALGTSDPDFAQGMLRQIANVGSQGPIVDEDGCNFVLAVIAGLEPRDQVEAMLAAQMAAVHNATINMSRRLMTADNTLQRDSAEKAFNKLARTFTAQVEALKRYRSKGEQRVYVERVNVERGGQAIVGNVRHGEGQNKNGG